MRLLPTLSRLLVLSGDSSQQSVRIIFRLLLCFHKGEARAVWQMEIDVNRLADVWSVREGDIDYYPCPNAPEAVRAKIVNLSGDSRLHRHT